MDMLKVFDVASPNECFERSESIVPQQALALANSKLSLTMARDYSRSNFRPRRRMSRFHLRPAIERQSPCMAALTRSSWRRHSTASSGASRAAAELHESLEYLRSRRRFIATARS